jgi:predicted nucleotidyltransferase
MRVFIHESTMSTQQVITALEAHPDIELAFVYGSVARGQARSDSDVDVAVQAPAPLDANEKMRLIEDIAAATGRAVVWSTCALWVSRCSGKSSNMVCRFAANLLTARC